MSALQTSQLKSRLRRPRPLSATLLACALIVVAAACVAMLTPIVWTAGKMALEVQPSTVAQCEMIAAPADRLACFDRLGKQALEPPAKGALAPVLAR
jgi:predicted PurR-regulated permease PerM